MMTAQRRRALLLLDAAYARAEAVDAEVKAREQPQPAPPPVAAPGRQVATIAAERDERRSA